MTILQYTAEREESKRRLEMLIRRVSAARRSPDEMKQPWGPGLRSLEERLRKKRRLLELELEQEQEQQEEDGDVLQADLGPLPEDLFMKIVTTQLPVPKLFQLRLVCKSWYSLLQSKAFRETWSLEAPHRPSECWFVMASTKLFRPFANELIAWSSSTGSWFQFPPARSIINHVARKRPWHCKHSVSQLIVASAGGLVCAVIDGPRGPSDYSVCVFNILTGAVKRLPPHLKYDPCCSASSSSISISIFANSATGSYCVTLSKGYKEPLDKYDYDILEERLANYDYGNLFEHLEVYDSKSGCWKVARDCQTPRASSRHISVLDGDLFLYASDGILSAYNIEEDAWSEVEVESPQYDNDEDSPYVLQRPKVLKWKGRVLLVASLIRCAHPSGENYDIILEGYGVWELQISSSNPFLAHWVAVATTPSQYWDGFHYCNRDLTPRDFANTSQFTYACHGDLICFTGVHYTDRSYQVEFCPPLVYDLALGSWYRLPFYRGCMDFLCAFSFEPSLTAMV